MQLQPGTYLQGDKYRIIRALGMGGFGITYLAEHELAGRNVCIKEFFPKEFYNRDDNSRSISLGSKGSAEIMDAYKAKFMKEAKTIARLDHPNIIHIFDVFAENNTAYYVMEYIEGESLSAVVKERGALAEAEAIKYIRAVAEALGYIHERKIMHLDIKPANVMLRKEDGRAILIDFGLSKQYDAEGNQTSSTPVGVSAGYAPMEQYQQGGVKEFSPETDIYSLGATLYYLVTGEVPPQAAAVVDRGLPELPVHLSNGVRNAIEHSMEIQSRCRPHSIKEFLALLEDNAPKVVAVPTPMPVSEETSLAASASAANECTVVGNAMPNAELPKPTQPKKEWTPKYAVETKKPSSISNKGKSRWWLWMMIIAVVVGCVAYFILSSENKSYGEPSTAEMATGEGGQGEGQGGGKGDGKDNNFSARCTVEYGFVNPTRQASGQLYAPAYRAEHGGVVVVTVQIDRDGNVKSAYVSKSSGYRTLDDVALRAAKHTKTKFNINSSAPQKHQGTITYTFIAQNDTPK